MLAKGVVQVSTTDEHSALHILSSVSSVIYLKREKDGVLVNGWIDRWMDG